MRSRLAALFILISLLAVPAGLYWYFFISQVASLSIAVATGAPYHITLIGQLDNKSLPLADSLIHIERDCIGECIFSPIAPIHYSLTLTSTGKTTITKDISLAVSESKRLDYVLQGAISIEPLDISPSVDPTIAAALIANAVTQDPAFVYTLIGIGSGNTVYAERRSTVTRELGTLSLEKFVPLWQIPKGVGDMTLDITGDYFVAPLFSPKSLILARDLSWQKEIPVQGVIGYSRGVTDDKVLTNSDVITSWHGSYGENPRFTDSLDISPTERLGYIAGDDATRLTLSNLPSGGSVLVLLDRTTGQSQVLKNGVDIRFLFFSQGVPVFLDRAGKMWKIEVGNK